MRRLLAAHALRESGEANGETGDLPSTGEGVEGFENEHAKSGGRALAANVLWLDANPDARQELAQASPGVVSPYSSQACHNLVECTASGVYV